MLGSGNTPSYDCLEDNQQHGFNAYAPTDPVNIVLDHDEIAGNDACGWEVRQPGWACTGGGKFWSVDGATVTDNSVRDNRGTGLWKDMNNRGFQFTGNYIADNDSDGIVYFKRLSAAASGAAARSRGDIIVTESGHGMASSASSNAIETSSAGSCARSIR